MLRFLRHLRRKLLAEGSMKKYLAYATGEIVLVVIGIMIAVQLNNCNQENSNKKIEIRYYLSMKDQLNEDLSKLLGEEQYNQDHLDQFYYAKKLLMDNNRDDIDTLAKITLHMVYYADFRRKSNVYQTLINSGEIKLISNHPILEHLQSLEEIYSYVNRIEETNLNVILYHVVPDLKQIISIDPIMVKDEEALFSYQFRNGIDLLIHLVVEKRDAYEHAKNEIMTTLKLIDEELGISI